MVASSNLLEAGTERQWGEGDPSPCVYLQQGPGFPSARLTPKCPSQTADRGTPQPLQSREPVLYREGINPRIDLCFWSSRENPAPRWAHRSEASSFHGLLTPPGKDVTMTTWPLKGPVSVSPGPGTLATSGEPTWTAGLTRGGLGLSTD